MKVESLKQILKRRKEIEKELEEFLIETQSDFTMADIKEMIYEEDDTEVISEILGMFDNGQGAVELDNVMDTINDAWNYFPHKILNGISPMERILEYENLHKK